jgi:hypothetical protein
MAETATLIPAQYAYEKLMADNKLELKDLPEDAKIGIETIRNIDKMMKINEKKGKSPSAEVLAKVKANDKWVVNEIIDFIDGKETNAADLPHDKDEIVDDIKEDLEEQKKKEEEEGADDAADDADDDADDADDVDDEASKPTPLSEDAKKALAATIEAELTEMFNSGKTEWKVDEIKAKAKNVYNTIFDTYEDGEDNGVETSTYRLLETAEEVFTISKI